MERMTGLDAGFLYMETPTLHMHTLKIAVLDPSGTPGGYSFERFREVLLSRLPLLPPFRRRIVEVPYGFHHPVWINDPDFDIDNHVRRVVAPSPGGPGEMDAVIGEIASTPLRRDRPLWEIWVIEGLAGGRFATVGKIHHAAADGVAANALLANVMAVGEPDPDVADVTDSFHPESIPSRRQLLRDALTDHRTGLREFPGLLRRTGRGLVAVARQRRHADVVPPTPIRDSPRTSFNTALTPRRSFASRSFSLDEIKRIKGPLGATINDVVLTVVGGALRRYLEQTGQPTDRPLVAGIPVSTDRPDDVVRLGGNKVSNLFTSLRTDIADPVERLRAVKAVTGAAKEMQNVLGAELYQDWNEYFPPRPYAWFMHQYSKRGLAARHAPPINLVVSNVPGPREPLSLAGARLDQMFSVGPILEGIGLNITCWSYCDRMNFSAYSCRDHLPDVATILDHCETALAELARAL